MTQNQLAYWRLQEDQRSHRANEAIGESQASAAHKSAAASSLNASASWMQAQNTKQKVANDFLLGKAQAQTNQYRAETDRNISYSTIELNRSKSTQADWGVWSSMIDAFVPG